MAIFVPGIYASKARPVVVKPRRIDWRRSLIRSIRLTRRIIRSIRSMVRRSCIVICGGISRVCGIISVSMVGRPRGISSICMVCTPSRISSICRIAMGGDVGSVSTISGIAVSSAVCSVRCCITTSSVCETEIALCNPLIALSGRGGYHEKDQDSKQAGAAHVHFIINEGPKAYIKNIVFNIFISLHLLLPWVFLEKGFQKN